MPAEPNHKMDDLLKAYSKKRRAEAGDPLPLHPATRKLLQAEVARLRPGPGPVGPSRWLWMAQVSWARLVLGISIFLLLGVTSWLFLRTVEKRGEPAQFAKRRVEAIPAPSMAPSEPEGLEARQNHVRALADATAELSKSEPAVAQPPPAKPPLPRLQERSDVPGGGLPTLRRAGEGAQPSQQPARQAANVSTPRDHEELAVQQRPAPLKNESDVYAQNKPTLAAPAATPLSADDKKVKEVIGRVEQERTALLLGESANVPALGEQKLTLSYLTNAQAFSRPVAGGQAPSSQSLDSFSLLTGGVLLQTDPQKKAVADQSSDVAARQRYFDYRAGNSAPTQQANTTVRQRFLQVLPGAKSAALKKAVDAKNTILGRFDLEQTGDRLRVVDGDGSVYDGQMIDGAAGGKDQGVAAATGVTRSDALSGKPAAVSPRGLEGVRGVTGTAVGAALRSFRVTGTNRTFRLPVVFEGVVFTTADGTTNLLPVQRVQGKVRLGTMTEEPLEALQVGN